MAAVSHFSGGPAGIDVSPPVALLQTTTYPAARPSVLSGGIGPAADYSRAAVATARIATVPIPVALPGATPRKRELLTRTLECLPAAIALFVISSLVWGPIFAPVPFAVCILSFHAYWTWRAHMTGIHAFKGFRLLRKHEKIDWRARYDEHAAEGKEALPWEQVRHIVIIPNYTESAEKLRMCLDALCATEMPSQIVAVLAMEEREGRNARIKAEQLQREYSGRLGRVLATFHPWGIPGEAAGKSSNENWAARRATEQLIDRDGGDLDLFTITSCDVDTVVDKRYFSCLTYNFATHPARYRRFWQGPIFYYNNIWHVPAPARLPHALAGLNHLGRLSRGFMRISFPQSTYSLSLRMAHDVGYWDPDIIPEDWHMFLKCYYKLGADIDVETMYTPVYMDGIRSKTYMRTFVNYFEQARRHAWGCTDIPYAASMALDSNGMSRWHRVRRLWALCESHFLWSTQWFLVTLGRFLPVILTAIGIAAMPDWFTPISRWLLAPCAGPLLLLIFLDARLRPRRPYPFQYAQWFAMAGITFFSSALPALDAQVRLAIGKRMEYKVTEKA
jgi:hypothetical protein